MSHYVLHVLYLAEAISEIYAYIGRNGFTDYQCDAKCIVNVKSLERASLFVSLQMLFCFPVISIFSGVHSIGLCY